MDNMDATVTADRGTFHAFSTPDAKIGYISMEDLGAVGAEVVAHPERYINKALYLSTEVASFAEVAAMMGKEWGCAPPRVVPLDDSSLFLAKLEPAFKVRDAYFGTPPAEGTSLLC